MTGYPTPLFGDGESSDVDDPLLPILLGQLPEFLDSIGSAGANTVADNLTRTAHGVICFYEAALPKILSFFADPDLLARHQAAVRERNGGPQIMLEAVADYIRDEQGLGRLNPNLQPMSVAALLVAPCFQWVFTAVSTGELMWPDQPEIEFVTDLVTALCRGAAPPGP